jgi:hypothetical protein
MHTSDWSELQRTRNYMLLAHLRLLPQSGGSRSPGYPPQALGILFVTSYGKQCYGGSINFVKWEIIECLLHFCHAVQSQWLRALIGALCLVCLSVCLYIHECIKWTLNVLVFCYEPNMHCTVKFPFNICLEKKTSSFNQEKSEMEVILFQVEKSLFYSLLIWKYR